MSVWCNGNIRDFQSQAEGSIPSTDYMMKKILFSLFIILFSLNYTFSQEKIPEIPQEEDTIGNLPLSYFFYEVMQGELWLEVWTLGEKTAYVIGYLQAFYNMSYSEYGQDVNKIASITINEINAIIAWVDIYYIAEVNSKTIISDAVNYAITELQK